MERRDFLKKLGIGAAAAGALVVPDKVAKALEKGTLSKETPKLPEPSTLTRAEIEIKQQKVLEEKLGNQITATGSCPPDYNEELMKLADRGLISDELMVRSFYPADEIAEYTKRSKLQQRYMDYPSVGRVAFDLFLNDSGHIDLGHMQSLKYLDAGGMGSRHLSQIEICFDKGSIIIDDTSLHGFWNSNYDCNDYDPPDFNDLWLDHPYEVENRRDNLKPNISTPGLEEAKFTRIEVQVDPYTRFVACVDQWPCYEVSDIEGEEISIIPFEEMI